MQSIYDPTTTQDFIGRIEKLTPGTTQLWGKMNVAQMMAHCCISLEIAIGDANIKPGLLSKLMGPLIKSMITNEKPFKQNMPTHKSSFVTEEKDFQHEKTRLIMDITRLSNAKESMNNKKHPFLGRLTATEWSNAMVKHLDHHLKQFGV